MKKNKLIGYSLSIVGVLTCLEVMLFIRNSLASGWNIPPGRFFTTVAETGMVFPLITALCILVVGLVILAIAYKKEA